MGINSTLRPREQRCFADRITGTEVAPSGSMQTAFTIQGQASRQLDWIPPEWDTLVLSTHPEDTIWGCGGLIGMQSRRGVPVTILSIRVSDEVDWSTPELEQETALRRAANSLGFGSTIKIVPVNLPNKSRLQQEVALMADIWPFVSANTLIVAPRLDEVSNRAAQIVCSTALSNVSIALASFPPVHVPEYEEDVSLSCDDARMLMEADLWEAKRDALRCFATETHPVVDGPFDLQRTGRFARLHEEFNLFASKTSD
jgi:hypothetical protein